MGLQVKPFVSIPKIHIRDLQVWYSYLGQLSAHADPGKEEDYSSRVSPSYMGDLDCVPASNIRLGMVGDWESTRDLELFYFGALIDFLSLPPSHVLFLLPSLPLNQISKVNFNRTNLMPLIGDMYTKPWGYTTPAPMCNMVPLYNYLENQESLVKNYQQHNNVVRKPAENFIGKTLFILLTRLRNDRKYLEVI